MVVMATTIGDVVKVTVETRWWSLVQLNVYFYRLANSGAGDALSGLSTEFQSTVLAPFAATQLNSMPIQSVSLENIFSGDVLVDATPTPAAGTRVPSMDPAASFLSASVRLVRANNRVRNGRKAIIIPQEIDMQGQQLSAAFLALLNTYAATLDDVLVAGLVFDWEPVIVGRVLYTLPSGQNAYRLPSTQEEMGENFSPVIGAIVNNRVSTQNSRKYWIGV